MVLTQPCRDPHVAAWGSVRRVKASAAADAHLVKGVEDLHALTLDHVFPHLHIRHLFTCAGCKPILDA